MQRLGGAASAKRVMWAASESQPHVVDTASRSLVG